MKISGYKDNKTGLMPNIKYEQSSNKKLIDEDVVQLGSEKELSKTFILQGRPVKDTGFVKDLMKNGTNEESGVNPFPSAPVIEHEGNLVKIKQEIFPKSSIEGLNELVTNGSILSYSIGENELIVYANSEKAAEELKKLKVTAQSQMNIGAIAKLKEIFIPPDLDENCAPEYLKYRAWSLGAAVCGGGIGFMTARVNLDAMKVAFSTTEKAALSGVINGMVSKFTSMGGSFLAKKGDADPKKFILASSLIASFNSLLTLGTLAVFPTALPVLTGFTAMSGALAGTLGSAAGVNIFNHMAKGPAKGLVSTKNANQDMVADMLGMPLALVTTRIASAVGMNPYIFTVATLGSLLALCHLNAAGSIRMDTLNQENIQKIADNYIVNREVPEADKKGVLETVKSLFSGDGDDYSKKIEFCDSLQTLVSQDTSGDTDRLFSIFKNENYILNPSKDKVSIVFKNKATVDDILKAYIHARLLEKGLSGKLMENLESLYGNKAPVALVELSYRSLQTGMRFTDELTSKGWHSTAVKVDMKKLDINWSGPDEISEKRIDMQKFVELAEKPEAKELKELLDYGYGT